MKENEDCPPLAERVYKSFCHCERTTVRVAISAMSI